MYLLPLVLVAALAWRKRSAIGGALAALIEPFRARPGVRIDAEMLGVQLPPKMDWSAHDAPAVTRLVGRKAVV